MLHEHSLIAIEGLDGVGKTTVARALADHRYGAYISWKDGNDSGVDLTTLQDQSDEEKFSTYIKIFQKAHQKAEVQRRKSDVFFDGSVVKLLAYHLAMDMPDTWRSSVPEWMLHSIDKLIYLYLPEHVRRQRLEFRAKETGIPLSENDRLSLRKAPEMDTLYKSLIPERTLVIPTVQLKKEQAPVVIWANLNGAHKNTA